MNRCRRTRCPRCTQLLSVSFGLAACLLLGLLAFTGCSSSKEGTADEPAKQQQAADYAVEISPMDGEALLADFSATSASSELTATVGDVQLEVDRDTRHVDMTLSVASSDVSQLCETGQAVAQCLSNHATVTDASGAQVSGDEGPCGALFQAYSLSLRVEGLGFADVFDGMLEAGGDELVWQ